MSIKEKSPVMGDVMSGSPWALISISPAASQQQLGHSTSDRGHQALRYRSLMIIAGCQPLSTARLQSILAPGFLHSFTMITPA